MNSGSDDDDLVQRPKKPLTETDRIIQEALDADVARKKQKKGIDPFTAGDAVKVKGKTFAEIEAEEGGPVKESLVGMAHVKRAINRKQQGVAAVDDTDIPADVDAFAEKAEVQEEDGIKFTGFNLEEEKETGHFDEEGNYVERKEKDETEKDGWLNSEDAKVVSNEVRAKIEERQRKEAEAEAAARRAGPMTDRQIAKMKAEMARHMQAGETLAKALKRLGAASASVASSKALGKRERARLQQQQQAAPAGAPTASTPDVKAVFERVTELAGLLVEEGEMDVYDCTAEDFCRTAAMWLPKGEVPLIQGGGAGKDAGGPAVAAGPAGVAAASTPALGGVPAAQASGAAADDEDDDMFGSEDGAAAAPPAPAAAPAAGPSSMAATAAPANTPGTTQPASASGRASAGPGAGPGEPSTSGQGEASVEQYLTWPVKELKRFLQERGMDPSSYVEKGDLARRVAEVAARGPEVAQGGAAPGAYPAPPGYAFDAASGYFLNPENGMFFDTVSGGYFSAGQWYTWDAQTNSFVAWAA